MGTTRMTSKRQTGQEAAVFPEPYYAVAREMAIAGHGPYMEVEGCHMSLKMRFRIRTPVCFVSICLIDCFTSFEFQTLLVFTSKLCFFKAAEGWI